MPLPASLATRTWRACALAVVLLAVAGGGALVRAETATPATQGAAQTPAARLDADKATVDRIEAALGRADVSDATLQQFRGDLDPVSNDLQGLVAELGPRLDAAKARLDQLGPKPADKAAAEAPDITAERQAQEKLFSDLDATVKRAKVLGVQVGQLGDTVAARRRALFARSVLERSSSLVSPALWVAVAQDLPSDGRALAYLGQDWWGGVVGKAEGWKVAVVSILIGILALVFFPALRISRRFKHRHRDAKPTRLKQALFALWVALVTMAIPTLLVAAAIGVLNGADFITFRLQPIAHSLQLGTLVVGTMVGLARGLLAPGLPNWRLVKISDASARNLYTLTVFIAATVAIVELLAALNDAIAVALPTAVATRGLGVLLVAVAMARTLHRIDRIVGAMDQGDAPQTSARNWSGPARILGWTVATVLGATLLVGYVAFGSFITKQIIYLSGLFSLLYLLMILADQGVAALFQPKTRLGRTFIVTAGFRRESLEQIAILLSGVLRVVLIAVATLLALAPWRIGSGDAIATLQGAFFGFNVGDVTISLSTIIVAVILFIVGITVTRALQRWLDVTYLPHTHLDTGLRNSIKTSIGYLGVVAAVAVAAGYLGLSFEKVTYVAGALSVGIGFGLQSVVSNFVSGLIILWERAIRVGDWIVVGADEGFVRRINVRSTEIETFDRATVIVPNQNLMTGVVKNWVRGDRVGRILLPITVGLAAKPEQMREMLIGIAKDHDRVLKIPSPTVLFSSYAGDQMTFNLICFVEDVEAGKRTTSDLLFTIHGRLTELGIIAPAGPAQLASPALEKAIALLMEDKDATVRQARRA